MATNYYVIYDRINEILTDSEVQLVVEALYKLREVKQGALKVALRPGMCSPDHPFTPQDFGIPQIEELIKKFQGGDD